MPEKSDDEIKQQLDQVSLHYLVDKVITARNLIGTGKWSDANEMLGKALDHIVFDDSLSGLVKRHLEWRDALEKISSLKGADPDQVSAQAISIAMEALLRYSE